MVENPEEELWEPMEYFHVRMETFDELENVNEEWMEVKQRVRDFFETHSYTEALEEYKKSGDYNEIWYEHILVYFTYRYFMRAWYDGNVLAKAQFAIVGFLVIRDMDIVRYFANGKVSSWTTGLRMQEFFQGKWNIRGDVRDSGR